MNSESPHRLLLLDDHTLFAEGLSSKFGENGWHCDLAMTQTVGLELLQAHHYDVLLCDINLDGENGFDLVQSIVERHGGSMKIWMLSAYNEPYLIEKAKRLRVDGYCTKTTPFEDLLVALNQPSKSFRLLGAAHSTASANGALNERPQAFILTRQEKKIIQLVVDGLSSKEIAERLFISKYTVDTHRRNILKKLDVKSITGLIKIAHANRLVD